MVRLLLLFALLPSARRDLSTLHRSVVSKAVAHPTARFTYKCAGLQCVFTSKSRGLPNKFAWDWGDSRSETQAFPTAKLTWAAPRAFTMAPPCKNGGTDGKDPGADMSAVLAATTGVMIP